MYGEWSLAGRLEGTQWMGRLGVWSGCTSLRRQLPMVKGEEGRDTTSLLPLCSETGKGTGGWMCGRCFLFLLLVCVALEMYGFLISLFWTVCKMSEWLIEWCSYVLSCWFHVTALLLLLSLFCALEQSMIINNSYSYCLLPLCRYHVVFFLKIEFSCFLFFFSWHNHRNLSNDIVFVVILIFWFFHPHGVIVFCRPLVLLLGGVGAKSLILGEGVISFKKKFRSS